MPRLRLHTAMHGQPRRGAVLVMSALLMIVIFAMAAMAIDVGYMMLMKTQLQAAADAGALAGGNVLQKPRLEVIQVATDFTARHRAGGRDIQPSEVQVELGIYDQDTDTFTPDITAGNAVRVTARRDAESLFFARIMGTDNFSTEASAIALANPKDIAFVVDLSGSMNDDTEPAWATSTINSTFGPQGFPGIGNQLMQDVYDDFGFGTFPGQVQYLGEPFGVARGSLAYAEMTSDIGPLAAPSIPTHFRIVPGDNEQTRRVKCYGWIIENQLATLMPEARPRPSLGNYRYWEQYINYVLQSSRIGALPPPPPPSPLPSEPQPTSPQPSLPQPPRPPIGWTPNNNWLEQIAQSPAAGFAWMIAQQRGFSQPIAAALQGQLSESTTDAPGFPREGGQDSTTRGYVPPGRGSDRIDRFNNPNSSSFPNASLNLPRQLRNFFGYLTYTQFLMDYGRDLRPDNQQLSQLSLDSSLCPLHLEVVAGRSFEFPPRSQPMHAVRRAAITAIDLLEQRNTRIPSSAHRDRVGIVTFDSVAGSRVLKPLSASYRTTMEALTQLQASGDKGNTTATESGLILANQMLRPASQGGTARTGSTKVAILMTDGIPNAFESATGVLDSFARTDTTGDVYGGGFYWLDAALMQIDSLANRNVDVFPVGVGLGADSDFLDRSARFGGTAGSDGAARRSSGNPAEYEQLLVQIFKEILSIPTARLVQ